MLIKKQVKFLNKNINNAKNIDDAILTMPSAPYRIILNV
jgi:hypothetical protein